MRDEYAYTIEDVKEDIFVPGEEVYILTGKLVPLQIEKDDPDYEDIYEEFIIPRNEKLFREIIESSRSDPYWMPFKDLYTSHPTFRNTNHLYVNGKWRMCYMYYELSYFFSFEECFKNFKDEDILKKVFNSMVLNEENESYHGKVSPYHVYVYLPRYNRFVIKRDDEVLPDEIVFWGDVKIDDYCKYLRLKYDDDYANFVFNKAENLVYRIEDYAAVYWKHLKDICHEYIKMNFRRFGYDNLRSSSGYCYDLECKCIEDIKQDIAATQLKKFDYKPDSGTVYY